MKNHKDVTLQGTKRFMDKSGEYYLKNVQMQNRRHDFNRHRKSSLNNPQNLENCLNGNLLKIKKRASKIVTLLPENSLTPIPKKEGINKMGFANGFKKKELNDAQRTAVFIRRLEYATTMKKKLVRDNEDEKDEENKIILIQEWWRTMYKIIKLQKNVRGFIFRKKLMEDLEHQEKLYQFITEFDNIYNYNVFRRFMDNLKHKRDYERAKYMEKCEDFGEKLENLEKKHNLKKLRKCLNKWNTINKKEKKIALDNLLSKLNDLLIIKNNNKKLDTLKKIKNKAIKEKQILDDKIKAFREKKAKEKFVKNLIRMHKLNKILNKINDKVRKKYLKNAINKLRKVNNISKATEIFGKILDNKMKKYIMKDLKNIYFIEKVNDIIIKHNDNIDNQGKKDLLNKLREINNKQQLKNVLNKWKNLCNELDNRRQILNSLIKYKKEEKNKLIISKGINEIQLIPEKKPELINFKFDDIPDKKIQRVNIDTLKNQLNDISLFIKRKILKKYLDKWKAYIESKELKQELIKYQTKKIAGNKLINIINKNDLREYFNKWKEISQKMKQNNLNNLIEKINNILTIAKKESNDKLKKEAFEILIKNNNIITAIEKLKQFLDNKPKKDCFNTLKKKAGMREGFRILERIFNKKGNLHKKEFCDELRKDCDIRKALEKLDELNEIINQRLIKKAFDRLVLNNNIKKACEILEKLINNKLIKDTWKKLISLDFVDLLIRYKNKKDKANKIKKEKIKKITNSLHKLKRDEKKNIINKYLDKWKDIIIKRTIKEKLLEQYKKKKAFNHWKNIKEIRDISNELGKYLKKKKYEIERKNIFANVRKKKLLGNIIKQAEKDKLNIIRKYFNIWKENKNKIQKKESTIKFLLNIYQQSQKNSLKKFYNKWLSNIKLEELGNDFPKYRKKPKFKEKEIIIEEEEDINEFNPVYYNSKKNIFKDEYIPFKKYPKKENIYNVQSQETNYIETSEKEAPKIKRNLMKLKKYDLEYNDTSSNEDTIQGIGETLIQRQKVVGEPRNYTSQSFFIDKNIENNSQKYDINSYNKNILPMKMKGDFLSLIERNPKILKQKNPRIQVTNATCNLDQIINNEENTDNELNQDEIDNEIDKLNDNFVINKNKVLSKVIKNCDKDLYAAQKPFKVKKEKWYSVGIPLNNNEAKWEFLNIKGERGKNDVNKFELIQKESEPIKEEVTYNKKSILKRNNINSTKNKDTSFKLREMNYIQYYRSPGKSPKNENENEIIRYDRLRKPQKRQNNQNLLVDSSSQKKKSKNKYNIDRSHGKIELDPKIKKINYDDYIGESDDDSNY